MRHQSRDPGLSRFFFAASRFFSRAKFQARLSGNLAGPRKKNKLGIPAAGLALTQPRRDFFFADREISSPAGLKFGRPRAGRARPIRDSL